MKQNKFDLAMAYIDANVAEPIEDIKMGIAKTIGMPIHHFMSCFRILTNDRLDHYIWCRKLYYAAQELQAHPGRRIVDVALDFGYAEHATFIRSMENFYNCKPSDVQSGKASIPNDRCYLADIYGDEPSTQVQRILHAFEHDEELTSANVLYWIDLCEAGKEYGFDMETCGQIADLAENLRVPVFALMHACFDTMVEVHSDPGYLSPETEAAIKCGIETEEELDAICEFYGCKYYDLDYIMVDSYRRSLSEEGSPPTNTTIPNS